MATQDNYPNYILAPTDAEASMSLTGRHFLRFAGLDIEEYYPRMNARVAPSPQLPPDPDAAIVAEVAHLIWEWEMSDELETPFARRLVELVRKRISEVR